MTPEQGDYHNCKCPHCGKTNHDITRGIQVPKDVMVVFHKPCFHCQKEVYYEAWQSIKVTAEATNPLEREAPPPTTR